MEVRCMTYARKSLVSLDDTPYYHVVSRCVRRAWLCGYDEYAGRDYTHRKYWILEHLALLTSMFAVDVCAYAVMSNHYHLVVHVDRSRALKWSREEVVAQWTRLFGTTTPVQRWLEGQATNSERRLAEEKIEQWRGRLYNISWFMRCLNQHLARKANAEDNCTGRFWEGRFKSQALLDEAGLLTAMAYVDLNPIRAGIAETLADSQFTSIYQRIRDLKETAVTEGSDSLAKVQLLPFQSPGAESMPIIPFRLDAYLELVDWSARSIVSGRVGSIGGNVPPIMTRLNVDADAWGRAMRPRGNVFGRAMGRLDHLRLHAKTLGQSWVRGLRQAERLYCS
jgi:REP element-mobilizing transposase RayT